MRTRPANHLRTTHTPARGYRHGKQWARHPLSAHSRTVHTPARVPFRPSFHPLVMSCRISAQCPRQESNLAITPLGDGPSRYFSRYLAVPWLVTCARSTRTADASKHGPPRASSSATMARRARGASRCRDPDSGPDAHHLPYPSAHVVTLSAIVPTLSIYSSVTVGPSSVSTEYSP